MDLGNLLPSIKNQPTQKLPSRDYKFSLENLTEDGVVALGLPSSLEKLDWEIVVAAYTQGVFPWPHPGYPMLWFSPDSRGVLDFKDLHLSTSLKKSIRRRFETPHPYVLTLNADFKSVIQHCQKLKRPGQKGTWITDEMKRVYGDLHQNGWAMSVECWKPSAALDGEHQLVGGIYGVTTEKYFSAESMFYFETDISKICFVSLVQYLKSLGHEWMDLQMITDVSGALGGHYMTKPEFLKRIRPVSKK